MNLVNQYLVECVEGPRRRQGSWIKQRSFGDMVDHIYRLSIFPSANIAATRLGMHYFINIVPLGVSFQPSFRPSDAISLLQLLSDDRFDRNIVRRIVVIWEMAHYGISGPGPQEAELSLLPIMHPMISVRLLYINRCRTYRNID